MPARVIPNNKDNNKKNPKVEVKAPNLKASLEVPAIEASLQTPKVKDSVQAKETNISENAITQEMQSILKENVSQPFLTNDRASFYAGKERLDLQGESVQRVRDLQEENDHLQRDISAKEAELTISKDPLTILADIEHRKIMIARNTGEILKIYLRNEERIKRIEELEKHNEKIQAEMMEMQGQFISTKNMEEKTKFASEFFVLKSQIERNLKEISTLNQK